ncbi:MAG: hypothetical protein VW405_09410, partial [Rhodospirillaceae bacterium]
MLGVTEKRVRRECAARVRFEWSDGGERLAGLSEPHKIGGRGEGRAHGSAAADTEPFNGSGLIAEPLRFSKLRVDDSLPGRASHHRIAPAGGLQLTGSSPQRLGSPKIVHVTSTSMLLARAGALAGVPGSSQKKFVGVKQPPN